MYSPVRAAALLVLLAAVAVGCGGSGRTPTIDPATQVIVEAPRILTPMVVEPRGTSQPQPSELETPMAPETTVDRDLQEAAVTCQQTWFLTGAVTCIGDLVRRAGPERVLRAVAQAIEAGDIDGSTDTHSLAHEVGRQTARVFGLGGQAFLGCSIAFNYGCQHGFFEQALASSPNATEAAIAICEDLVGSEPTKMVFYCYHGVGHGVMMASAYDLDVALEVCDSLGEAMASDGCWQGVFMENVNSVMRGEAREGVFSDSDPLAPCNRVADRHKWECYINHAGRLITLFDLSVRDASHACLDAAGRFVLACVQSLGLMVSNPAWQATLVGPTSHGRNIEVTLELCGRFPEEYRRDCLIGAVDNIMNFDGVALDRALRFCRATDGPDREPCYRRIGFAIGVQVVEPQGRWDLCLEVDEPYRTACAAAAGIEAIEGGQAVLRPQSSAGAQVRQVVGSAAPASTSRVSAKPEGNAQTVTAPSVRTIEVRYEGRAFVPRSVTLRVGDTVVWSNEDDGLMWPASDDHPTHEGYPGFDARRPIASGASWSFTFDRAGVWGYHNHMAPRAEGQVIVQE